MKINTLKIILVTLVVVRFAYSEENPNSLYDDYIARRDAYYAKAVEVQREFLAIKDFKWELVIDRPSTWEKILVYDGASHVELYGEAKTFAEKYTPDELASGLYDLLDAPRDSIKNPRLDQTPRRPTKLWTNLVAFAFAKGGMDAGPPAFPRWPYYAYEAEKIIGSRDKPRNFSGFDRDQVSADIRANPSRRQEYVDAIVKILADPNIRHENPLETKNLLDILFYALDSVKAIPTLIDYMFFDYTTGENFRLQDRDFQVGEDGQEWIPQRITNARCWGYLATCGRNYIPDVLWRFVNASEIERKVGVGGGGVPLFAMLYFRDFVTANEALEYLTDFKRDNVERLTDEQKKALDEIIVFIKEKRFRSERLLENSNEAVRTWAPSYGKVVE